MALIKDYKAEVNDVMILLVPVRPQKKNKNFRWFKLSRGLRNPLIVNGLYIILSSKQYFLFTHAAPYNVKLDVITAWNLYQIRHQK